MYSYHTLCLTPRNIHFATTLLVFGCGRPHGEVKSNESLAQFGPFIGIERKGKMICVGKYLTFIDCTHKKCFTAVTVVAYHDLALSVL